MGKPVAPRLYISPRNRIYHLYESVPFIGKRPQRPETGIKDGLKKWNMGQLYFQDLPIYNKLNISSAKVEKKNRHPLPFEIFRPKNRTSFSDVPLLLEIFRWNEDPKSRLLFTFQQNFPESFCKW